MNNKELFLLSLTIFLTIVAWMLMDIYRIKNTKVIDTSISSLKIVDYKIDPTILKVLKERTP